MGPGCRYHYLVPAATDASRIPGRHRPCFIDSECSTVEVLAVDLGNGLVAAILHFHEAESLRATGVAIGDNTNRLNQTSLREQFLEFSFRRFKRQISNKEFLCHVITF